MTSPEDTPPSDTDPVADSPGADLDWEASGLLGDVSPEDELPGEEWPSVSPLRGPELVGALALFGASVAGVVLTTGPEGYRGIASFFGESARAVSLAVAVLALVAAVSSWIPWLLRAAPTWPLSLGLFLGVTLTSPVVLVTLIQPSAEDGVGLVLLGGLAMGVMLGVIYVARIMWEVLDGGTILAAPCALVGLLGLPGLIHTVWPEAAGWIGVGGLAVGGIFGYGVGFLVGFLVLNRFARGIAAALCLVPAGISLGAGLLALGFAIG